MASSFSVVHPTTLRHFLSRTFCSPRPFSSATSVVSVHCLFSSSSSATMTTSKITMKSISSQTNTTVLLYNPDSSKVAIFKTLALKIGNKLKHGTIALQPAKLFFKIMHNIFSLSSKKIPFEQYYRLHNSGPTIAICGTKSNNVFVLTHTSFDQNNFYFLHINAILYDFGFFFKNWFSLTRPNTLLSQILPPILKTSNLVCCRSFILFFAVFAHLPLLLLAVSSSSSLSSPIFNFSL